MAKPLWIKLLPVLLFFIPEEAALQPLWKGLPLWEKTLSVKDLKQDKLGQVYVLTPADELIKFSPEGELIARFSRQSFGEVMQMDVSDPLQVLLWYPDFQTILLLDRTLNPYASVLLPLETIPAPVLAAWGRENHLWVYDRSLSRLLKLDQQGRLLMESQDLSQTGQGPHAPVSLIAGAQGVYMADPETGIWCFDRLGQYQVTLPLPGVDFIQNYRESALLFRQKGQFFLLPESSSTPVLLELPSPCTHLFFQPKRVLAYSDGKVQVFTF